MPITPLGAAAIGAGLNTLGGFTTSLLSRDSQREAEDRSYYRSLELMRQQNQFNVAMWERQNRYNSPSNQLKLMQDAGINPALFDMKGQQPAAEVTSAEAAVPYNSQAGKEYEQLGLGKIGDQTLQALQVDAQIAKLRNDIKYQGLVNRDLENQIRAREQKLPSPLNDLVPEGEQTVYPNLNAYEEDRYKGRYDYSRNSLAFMKDSEELRVYKAVADDLKRIPHQQLRKLEEEVDDLIARNVFNSDDLAFLKRYGINPRDGDGWSMLMKLALRDPDKFHDIVSAVINAGSKASSALVDNMASGLGDFISTADLDEVMKKASVPYAIGRKIYENLSHINPPDRRRR